MEIVALQFVLRNLDTIFVEFEFASSYALAVDPGVQFAHASRRGGWGGFKRDRLDEDRQGRDRR